MEALDEILPFIYKKEFVLFMGAGISALGGCRLWKDLVIELSKQPLIKEKIDMGLSLSNDLLEAVQQCFDIFKESGKIAVYREILRLILDEDSTMYKNKYVPFINKLTQISPFPINILTINIDDLLAKAKREVKIIKNYEILFVLQEMLDANKSEKSIYHIHGMRDDLDHALLIKSLIDTRYKYPQFISFIKYFFNSNSVLFMGVGEGLRDLNLLNYCRRSKRKHFALINKESKYFTKKIIAQYLADYNIKVVIYGSKNDYEKIVEAWVDRNFPLISVSEPREDIAQIQ